MHAKLLQLLAHRYPDHVGRHRVTSTVSIPTTSPILLHCVNSSLPEPFCAGARIYLSEASGRSIVATISVVVDVSSSEQPYRDYGIGWSDFMMDCNTNVPPELCFK